MDCWARKLSRSSCVSILPRFQALRSRVQVSKFQCFSLYAIAGSRSGLSETHGGPCLNSRGGAPKRQTWIVGEKRL